MEQIDDRNTDARFFYWNISILSNSHLNHDDVIKWKHFPRYWPFVRGIHRSQWRGALMFSLNKRLSKQSWGWWFETLSRPLWRHRNDSLWWSIDACSCTDPVPNRPGCVNQSRNNSVTFINILSNRIERFSQNCRLLCQNTSNCEKIQTIIQLFSFKIEWAIKPYYVTLFKLCRRQTHNRMSSTWNRYIWIHLWVPAGDTTRVRINGRYCQTYYVPEAFGTENKRWSYTAKYC